MISFGSLTLRAKLLITSMVVEALMLTLLVSNSLRLSQESLKDQAIGHNKDLSILFNAALAAPMAEHDYATLNEILHEIMQGEGIVYVVLTDPSGAVVASSGWESHRPLPVVNTHLNFDEAKDKRLDLAVPIKLVGHTYGVLSYGLSIEFLVKAQSHLLQQSVLIAIMEILLSFILLAALGYWLTRHLSMLTKATEAVALGDFNVLLPVKTDDEVGQLTRTFNVMSAAIQSRIKALIQNEEELLRFKNVLDNTLDMIFMFDPDSLRFIYVNQGALLNMGYNHEEWRGMTPCQIKPLFGETEFRKLISPLLSGEELSLRFETLHRRKDGSDFPVDIVMQLMRESNGSGLLVALVRDVTEKKESEEIIWQQANFDTLTGLPNRHMFYDRLELEMKKSHRSGLPMALMLLDLDCFKEVNDTLGHAQGDILLVEAARRIIGCVRESDTVARLGGDEFTIILSEVEDINSIQRIAQNIIERLAAPFSLSQEMAYVSASLGITLYPDDAQDIDSLIKNADQAMYLAKNSGRNRFSYFTVALQEAAQIRIRLLNDLRNAITAKQFEVYYQPIVQVATGKIYKAEGLLRWKHPEHGMVSPMQFIRLAEESGLIHEIGDWVFGESTRELKRWRERFVPEFQISVNVSPVQFRQNAVDYASLWIDHLHAMDLPGRSLVIEITEGVLLNAEINVTEKLLTFRDEGIGVSLDDFGTGYSSLSYLKKFDIDYLKIDQSFVRNMEKDTNDQVLCEAIIIMAHKLGLQVIAEGVETQQQRDLLAIYGCDYAQGWLYSKAVPADEFEALLELQGM